MHTIDDLDAQLQRRYDLIPNVVAAVKGVLNQEQAVFGQLAEARARYSGARNPEQNSEMRLGGRRAARRPCSSII